MKTICSELARPPVMLIHCGAGTADIDADRQDARRTFLQNLAESAWGRLSRQQTALDAVTEIIMELEASPLFNAGYGSALQSDGLARLSASLMDGERQKFSGILLATHLINPIRLARALQDRDESVLGPLGAQLLARELGIPPDNPAAPRQIERWAEQLAAHAAVPDGTGTVGAVVLDSENRLAAGTSTAVGRSIGPNGFPDSATVAGNYASGFAAVSCTGIGEEIVNDGLAVRLEGRVRDGANIVAASERTYQEAISRRRRYGWIAVDRRGAWAMCRTTDAMLCAAMSANRPAPVLG